MKKDEQEWKKIEKKIQKKYKGKKTTALISTKDSEEDGENWECTVVTMMGRGLIMSGVADVKNGFILPVHN